MIVVMYLVLILLGVITKKYEYFFTLSNILFIIAALYYKFQKKKLTNIKIIDGIEVCAV